MEPRCAIMWIIAFVCVCVCVIGASLWHSSWQIEETELLRLPQGINIVQLCLRHNSRMLKHMCVSVCVFEWMTLYILVNDGHKSHYCSVVYMSLCCICVYFLLFNSQLVCICRIGVFLRRELSETRFLRTYMSTNTADWESDSKSKEKVWNVLLTTATDDGQQKQHIYQNQTFYRSLMIARGSAVGVRGVIKNMQLYDTSICLTCKSWCARQYSTDVMNMLVNQTFFLI